MVFEEYSRQAQYFDGFDAMVKGLLYPWNPGPITLVTERALSDNIHIHVMFKSWPSISTVIKLGYRDLLTDPEEIYSRLYQEIVEHVRDVHIEPAENMILGEN